MNTGQLITISTTYGNSANLDDVAARGQQAIVTQDVYQATGNPLSHNLYEVRLVSGPAAGEIRLVTLSEISEV